MPYIKKSKRKKIDKGAIPLNSGELNYAITKIIAGTDEKLKDFTIPFKKIKNICKDYLGVKPLKYQIFNDIGGALISSGLETARRAKLDPQDTFGLIAFVVNIYQELYLESTVPYEEKKIKENGDLEEFKVHGGRSGAIVLPTKKV